MLSTTGSRTVAANTRVIPAITSVFDLMMWPIVQITNPRTSIPRKKDGEISKSPL